MKEEWKSVFGGNYEVSNFGGFRRLTAGRRTWPGRLIKPILMKIGYLTVRPVVDGKNVQIYLHRLVAETFMGACPDGMEVNHIDGNKANPSLSNLEYVSHSKNGQHAMDTGLNYKGDCHPRVKVTDAQVREIRAARLAGESGVSVARRFGISSTTVSEIIHGTKRSVA